MSGMKSASLAAAAAVFGLLASGPAAQAADKVLKIGAPLPLTGGLAPEPKGAKIASTLPSVIISSADCTARGVLDW